MIVIHLLLINACTIREKRIKRQKERAHYAKMTLIFELECHNDTLFILNLNHVEIMH
jgi:hypothetical protein